MPVWSQVRQGCGEVVVVMFEILGIIAILGILLSVGEHKSNKNVSYNKGISCIMLSTIESST